MIGSLLSLEQAVTPFLMDIGTLNEKPLHAALKYWYAQPGDEIEVKVDGYFIDIIQEGVLVEIQTRNFSAIKRKVTKLVQKYPLRLVYPIAQEKWIVKLPKEGHGKPTRRKSPKRGKVIDMFAELVSFPALMNHPNFSLEVLLIQEEEVRRHVKSSNWRRRGWRTEERRLLAVIKQYIFEAPADLWQLLPSNLPNEFTTSDLVSAMGVNRRGAQQLAYCLRKMNAIEQIGKRGRSNLYTKRG
jgi:hypothetical protein